MLLKLFDNLDNQLLKDHQKVKLLKMATMLSVVFRVQEFMLKHLAAEFAGSVSFVPCQGYTTHHTQLLYQRLITHIN